MISATIGFERSAAELGKPSKSLHLMLGPSGNPNASNFFAILQVLQRKAGVMLTVKAARKGGGASIRLTSSIGGQLRAWKGPMGRA